jgi:hypothetical protein
VNVSKWAFAARKAFSKMQTTTTRMQVGCSRNAILLFASFLPRHSPGPFGEPPP